MPSEKSPHDFILENIKSIKEIYPSLRNKSNDYVFSALCVKSNFYKNPALVLNDSDFADIIVDSVGDGGVDILLSDPNSEGSDLIIGQSKFYETISSEAVLNAMQKMASFYKDMDRGQFEQVNSKVQSRFLTLNSEVGDESKICFVFYTSAPQSGIRIDRIKKKFRDQFEQNSNIDIQIYFGSDIVEEIKESLSRRANVDFGKIRIDEPDNYLFYGEDAAIVNVSANSIKQLYAQHNTTLLSRNLRYHITGRDIDNAIAETINNSPDSFWLKNNGITIICDDFKIDGKEVKLKNFSIVNGGQTTYMLHKNSSINNDNDLFLPCKIVKIIGNTEDEKNLFCLSIAKATNSQKAIKPVDLKANSPEQVRFVNAMRDVDVFYQTKRGETVPKRFREPYLNTDLVEVGKLCLAGIFQMPGTCRSKPSSLYQDKYYDPIFNGNQTQIARICKELLYIDHYFKTKFQRQFDRDNGQSLNSNISISFAHNARTICIAFVAFASRYRQGNFTDTDLTPLRSNNSFDSVGDTLYKTFRNLGEIQFLLPQTVFDNKDVYEAVLNKLFKIIINAGIMNYSIENQHDPSLNATNYLKKDKNYYSILMSQWIRIIDDINNVFDEIGF